MQVQLRDKIMDLYQDLKNVQGGIFTRNMVEEMGHDPWNLRSLYERGLIKRLRRGFYILADAVYDDLYAISLIYPGIYSHTTALYLHKIYHTLSMPYIMTLTKGYHNLRFQNDDRVQSVTISPERLDFGVTTVDTPQGNPVRAYDLERTLCDIIRWRSTPPDSVRNAYIQVKRAGRFDFDKLISYAVVLNVGKQIRDYLYLEE